MNITANITTIVLPEWVYHEQIVYFGMIALIGIPGNILIILVFAYSRDRITTDYMVFSMAISDLFGSLVCTTLNMLEHIHVVWVWIGTAWVTRTSEYFNMLTLVISMWLLSLTAIDRYMKTCRPHSAIFTLSRARWMCVIICASVPTVTSPAFFAGRFVLSTEGSCKVVDDCVWAIPFYIIAAGCCISLLITAVAYMLVAFALCKRLKIKTAKRRATMRSNATGKFLCQTTLAGGGESRDQQGSSVPKSVPIDVNQVFMIEKTQNSLCSNVDEKSKADLQTHRNTGIDEVLRHEHKRVNRTTVMMFLITAINISTFMMLYIGQNLVEINLTNPEAPGLIIGYIIRPSHMINYIANPLLYMSMSSKFRESVRKVFRRQ